MESISSKIHLLIVAGAIVVCGLALFGISKGISYLIRKNSEKKAAAKKKSRYE